LLVEAVRRACRGIRRDVEEPHMSPARSVFALLGVTLGTMKLLVLALPFISRFPAYNYLSV
jgi:hypothetical protein